MMQQYKKLKQQYQDCILLFRLGDFYEGFAEDAKTLSKVLGIALTGRGKDANRVAMAGIPHHALKHYLPKLIAASLKVAIAEQLEEPQAGKIVQRDVTRVITAGTIMDEESLSAEDNNYIASVYLFKEKNIYFWGLCYADLTTGEFKTNQYGLRADKLPEQILIELYRIRPAEIIVCTSQYDLVARQLNQFNLSLVEKHNELSFTESEYKLKQIFGVKSLKGFGISELKAAIIAAANLYRFLENTQKAEIKHFTSISLIEIRDFMLLDQSTIKNLELIYPLHTTADPKRTLFAVLNNCLTAMGQRKLKNWILHPLINLDKLNFRQKIVSDILAKALLKKLRKSLAGISDLERVIGRIGVGRANARDLVFLSQGIKQSLSALAIISGSSWFLELITDFAEIKKATESVAALIDRSINESPPIVITEGNIIKAGYNKQLDELKHAENSGKDFIRNLQQQEIKKTGISSLKVRFNRVFGYYIEVSKSNLDKVPPSYIRKQTLVNAERFITEELKQWEEKVLHAEEKAIELELELFSQIRQEILPQLQKLLMLADAVATLDVLTNFAWLAENYNYTCPKLSSANGPTEIIGGRHPVVERFLEQSFVENDLEFNENQQLLVLTGPNMSGKSTYIRQTALIFIMAQIGAFVPAASAKIDLADRIFTRVGAADNLASGESTFMVEMSETANILNNATSRSLIILDEIGRGTSTHDGVAIAWSVAEFISRKLKARTLFATHYHELIELEERFANIKNFNVQVLEEGDRIVFMRKIIRGATDRSYGIHVARIAGIPESVIMSADSLLRKLENTSQKTLPKAISDDQFAFSDINQTKSGKLDRELNELDINSLTPLDALNKLKELKDKLNE